MTLRVSTFSYTIFGALLVSCICVMSAVCANAESVTNRVTRFSLQSTLAHTEHIETNISLRVGLPYRSAWTTRDIHRLMALPSVTHVVVRASHEADGVGLQYAVYGNDSETFRSGSIENIRRTQPLEKIVLKGFSFPSLRTLLETLPLTLPHWLWGEGEIERDSEKEIEEAVRSFYISNGFLDVLPHARIEYSRDAKAILYISVCEGPQYIVDEIQWKQYYLDSNSFTRLNRMLLGISGEPYSPAQVREIESTIYYACASHSSQKPYLSVRACISAESSPMEPLVTYFITLAPPRLTGVRRSVLPNKPISLLGLYGL